MGAPGLASVIVERVSNGAVTEKASDWDVSVKVRKAYKFDSEEGDAGGLVELLYDILEEIGDGGSRYSEKRVQIRLVHGDKYECKSGCAICAPEGAMGD